MNLKLKAKTGVKWSLIETVVSNFINFLVIIFLTKTLMPEDFGLVAMLTIFIGFSQVIVDSGFSQAIIQRNKGVTKKDCSTIFTTSFLISVFIYIIFFMLSDRIGSFFGRGELSPIIKILFVSLIINSFSIVPRALLSIKVDFKSQAIASIFSMSLSAIIAVFIANYGFGFWALVSLPLTKSLTTCILLIYFSSWKPIIYFNKKSFGKYFSFGKNLLLAGIINTFTTNIYSLILGKYSGARVLGFYNQSETFSTLLANNIINITQKVTFPILSSVKSDRNRLLEIYKKVMSLTMFISFPILLGFASISHEFILIFLSEEWIEMSVILMFLSIARAISPISMFNVSLLSAIGRADLILKIDSIKLPLIIIVLVITLPFGIEFVAFGQLLNTFLFFIINSYYSGVLFNYGFLEQCKLLRKTFFASLAMFLINQSFQLSNIYASLLSKIILGVIVYYVLCKCMNVKWISTIDNKVISILNNFKNN